MSSSLFGERVGLRRESKKNIIGITIQCNN